MYIYAITIHYSIHLCISPFSRDCLLVVTPGEVPVPLPLGVAYPLPLPAVDPLPLPLIPLRPRDCLPVVTPEVPGVPASPPGLGGARGCCGISFLSSSLCGISVAF